MGWREGVGMEGGQMVGWGEGTREQNSKKKRDREPEIHKNIN